MSVTTPDAAGGFMDDVVVPTVKEFLGELGSVRRGMLAALTVNSLVDHLFHSRPGVRGTAATVGKLRDEWAKLCPGFGLVRDVADAAKHVQLDRPSARLKNFSDIQQDNVIIKLPDGSTLMIRDGEGYSPISLGIEVCATLLDGSQHLLSDCLKEAMLFLQARMGRPAAWPPP